MTIKKNPAKARKSMLPPDFVPFAKREQELKEHILIEARAIVQALSQGPEAPSLEDLFLAARAFAESLRPQLESVYGPFPFSPYNALVNLTSDADMRLFHDPLKTVGCFSAALMAVARYVPMRR